MLARLRELLQQKLVKNTGWMMFGQAARVALQAIYFVLLARSLGPDGLGAFAGSLALVSILAPFAGWGSGSILIMRVSRAPAVFRSALGTSLVALGASGAVLSLLALGIREAFFSTSISATLLLTLCISELLFIRLVELGAQAFQAFDRMKATASLLVASNVVRVIAVVVFFLLPSGSVQVWAQWYLGAAVISGILALWITIRALGAPTLSLDRPRFLLREGFFFSLGISSKSVYTDIDKAMLLRLASPDVAGTYTAAYRLTNMAFLPIQALLTASYAHFFRAGRHGIRGSLAFALRVLPASLVYGAVVGVGLYLFAPLLPMILGASFVGSVDIVRWLAVLPLVQAVSYLVADSLTGAGLQGWRSIAQSAAAILNVALNLFLIPLYSWRGAVAATLATEVILALSLVLLARVHMQRIPETKSGARP